MNMFDEAEDIELEQSEFKGQLEDVESIKAFCLGGNARVTIKSKTSGKRYTYRINKKRGAEETDPFFVGVLRGSSNETDFAFIGSLFVMSAPDQDGVIVPMEVPHFVWSRKSVCKSNAPSVVAFNWFWRQIEAGVMPPSLEVWHEGRCGCCGRTLTVPTSIKNGIGPECMMKLRALELLGEL